MNSSDASLLAFCLFRCCPAVADFSFCLPFSRVQFSLAQTFLQLGTFYGIFDLESVRDRRVSSILNIIEKNGFLVSYTTL